MTSLWVYERKQAIARIRHELTQFLYRKESWWMASSSWLCGAAEWAQIYTKLCCKRLQFSSDSCQKCCKSVWYKQLNSGSNCWPTLIEYFKHGVQSADILYFTPRPMINRLWSCLGLLSSYVSLILCLHIRFNSAITQNASKFIFFCSKCIWHIFCRVPECL